MGGNLRKPEKAGPSYPDSTVLVVATVTLHLLFYDVGWVNWISITPNVTMSLDGMAAPLPMHFLFYQSIIIYALFSTLPFILSQQVYSAVIILAVLLGEAIKKLTREIHEETHDVEQSNGVFDGNGRELELTEKKVKNWQAYHMKIVFFRERLNGFFGDILFVVYGMDLLTLFGFLSSIVKNVRTDALSYEYLLLSSVIFLMYGTVFLIPLVMVHEMVSALKIALSRVGIVVFQCYF